MTTKHSNSWSNHQNNFCKNFLEKDPSINMLLSEKDPSINMLLSEKDPSINMLLSEK